jgi:hypothetical protein
MIWRFLINHAIQFYNANRDACLVEFVALRAIPELDRDAAKGVTRATIFGQKDEREAALAAVVEGLAQGDNYDSTARDDAVSRFNTQGENPKITGAEEECRWNGHGKPNF